MVPEDQLVAVRREILGGPFNKGRKCCGIGHDLRTVVLYKALQLAVPDAVDLVGCTADDVVLPSGAAAGVHQQIDVVRDRCFGHFHQIGGGHRTAGFQIGAAHVDHQGDGIFAAAQDLGVLCAGTGNDVCIYGAGISLHLLGSFLRRRIAGLLIEIFIEISHAAAGVAACLGCVLGIVAASGIG